MPNKTPRVSTLYGRWRTGGRGGRNDRSMTVAMEGGREAGMARGTLTLPGDQCTCMTGDGDRIKSFARCMIGYGHLWVGVPHITCARTTTALRFELVVHG